MGVQYDEEHEGFRKPLAQRGAPFYTWRNRPFAGPGIGVVIDHNPSEPWISVQFFDREVLIPLTQARWVADVLQAIADGYEEVVTGMVPEGTIPDSKEEQ